MFEKLNPGLRINIVDINLYLEKEIANLNHFWKKFAKHNLEIKVKTPLIFYTIKIILASSKN